MSDLQVLPPLDVRRITTPSGSHVEPPLEQGWDEATKLRWLAGVVLADTGIQVNVVTGCCTESHDDFGPQRVRSDLFGLSFHRSSSAGFTFHAAWEYLTGFSDGARAARGEA